MSESELSEADAVAFLNNNRGGYNTTMGFSVTRATKDLVVGVIALEPHHLQPYGIVHGGVLAGMIETACSTGAAIVALASGASVVGLENSTSFLRAVRGGTLTVTAKPLVRGRRSHVWEATVTGDDGKAVATGRVRLLCLEAGADLAGKKAGI